MERGFQVLCPCGYANSVVSLPEESFTPPADVPEIEPYTPLEVSDTSDLPMFTSDKSEPLEVLDDNTEEDE